MRILFVCLGNICRSPAAEAAVRAALAAADLDGQVEVDSAGTGTWHIGEPPDRRMSAAAERVGLHLGGRARRVRREDFEHYDLLLALDRDNLRTLLALAPDDEDARAKVRLFREFEAGADSDEVPDPYYGGPEGFDRVLEIVQAGARGLVDHLREALASRRP